MVTINYVIATYGGCLEHRSNLDKNSEYVLQYNLTCLFDILTKKKSYGLPSYIKQITVVCPPIKSHHKPYKNYYKADFWLERFAKFLPEVKLVFIKYIGENIHASYDQWIQGYTNFPDFDYYIVIEDDYCIHPQCVNFDTSFVNLHKKIFETGHGYLCSMAWNEYPHPYHAAVSNGIIDKGSLQLLGPNPCSVLYNYGGIPQVAFSRIFIINGIDVKDMRELYKVKFYVSPDGSIQDHSLNNTTHSSFTPVQCIYDIVKLI